MDQVDELLAVDVLEFSIPRGDLRALFIETVLGACEVEAVGGDGCSATHRHIAHAAVVTRTVGAQLPAVQRQAVDLLRSELAAAKGLWQ
ncbi:hypothetical protein D3C76_1740180 [compost metagenome]